MPDDPDDDVRALFHRIDDGPPLDIDVHEVMARGRQVRTRRTRLAVAGSALAAAVAATLVGVSIGADATSPDMFRPAESPTQHSTTVPEPPVVDPSKHTTSPTTGPAPPAGGPATEPGTNAPLSTTTAPGASTAPDVTQPGSGDPPATAPPQGSSSTG